jgi:hypothetical protein
MAYASDYYDEDAGKGASVLLLLVMIAAVVAICAYGYLNVLPKNQPPAIRFAIPETVVPFVPVPEVVEEPSEELGEEPAEAEAEPEA